MGELIGHSPEHKPSVTEVILRKVVLLDPVVVSRYSLNGDLLWDIHRKIDYLQQTAGGIILLYGTTRSGKSSIMFSLVAENPDDSVMEYVIPSILLQNLFEHMERKGLQTKRKVFLDEADDLGKVGIEQVVNRLLSDKKTVVATVHFGHEDYVDVYRSIAAQANAPFFVINMVSKDNTVGLQKRMKEWFTSVKVQAAASIPQNDISTFPDFDDSAYAMIGKITGFRPYEVSCFVRDFLEQAEGGKWIYTGQDVQNFFDTIRFGDITSYGVDFVQRWHEKLARFMHSGDQVGYEALKRIVKGDHVSRYHGEQKLSRLLEYTGLGFIASDQNGFQIKGDWLQSNWETWLG